MTDKRQKEKQYYCFFEGWYCKLRFEDSPNVLIMLRLSPRITLRVRKFRMFNGFRCNLLKTNNCFCVTQWDGAEREIWKIINWSHQIFHGAVRKTTYNNTNSLGMSCFSIIQRHSGLGWEKYRKFWYESCDSNIISSIFMKQHSRDCKKVWGKFNHY